MMLVFSTVDARPSPESMNSLYWTERLRGCDRGLLPWSSSPTCCVGSRALTWSPALSAPPERPASWPFPRYSHGGPRVRIRLPPAKSQERTCLVVHICTDGELPFSAARNSHYCPPMTISATGNRMFESISPQQRVACGASPPP